MYQVKIFDGPNDKIGIEIHSSKANSLKIKSDSLRLGINAIDGFRFTIYPNNPGFNKIKSLTTLVTVYDTIAKSFVFEGRVLGPEESMAGDGMVSATYQCGSFLSYLQDSVQSWAQIQDTSPRQLLQFLIDVHNSQVEDHKQFLLGEVNVTNTTDNVYYYIEDTATTYDMIMDRLIDRIGGELQIRNVDNQLYLDWVNEIGQTNDVTIRVQKNMISVSKENDPTEVITRLFPRGARLDPEDGDETAISTPRLTIASVNGGVEFIDADSEMIAEFGIRSGYVTWDDTTLAPNLLRNARNWLDNQSAGVLRVAANAVDLGLIGLDSGRFRVGDRYRCLNPLINLDSVLRIVEMSININQPEQSSLVLGAKQLSLAQYQANLKREQKKVVELEGVVTSHSKQIASVSRSANQAQQGVNELQKAFEEVDIDGVKGFEEFKKEVINQLDSLFDNIGEIGAEVTDLSNQIMLHTADFNAYKNEQSFAIASINERLDLLERRDEDDE